MTKSAVNNEFGPEVIEKMEKLKIFKQYIVLVLMYGFLYLATVQPDLPVHSPAPVVLSSDYSSCNKKKKETYWNVQRINETTDRFIMYISQQITCRNTDRKKIITKAPRPIALLHRRQKKQTWCLFSVTVCVLCVHYDEKAQMLQSHRVCQGRAWWPQH